MGTVTKEIQETLVQPVVKKRNQDARSNTDVCGLNLHYERREGLATHPRTDSLHNNRRRRKLPSDACGKTAVVIIIRGNDSSDLIQCRGEDMKCIQCPDIDYSVGERRAYMRPANKSPSWPAYHSNHEYAIKS